VLLRSKSLTKKDKNLPRGKGLAKKNLNFFQVVEI
jgi:hypothetical protein